MKNRATVLLLCLFILSVTGITSMTTATEPAKQQVLLLCNAHIDPVWLWEWEEGAAAAISTFRVAADLCEDFGFIFNHNEVILYEWVQEYEPALFKRIQRLVEQGKWHIMGGWYLQPDCNMPSGESFVRQILLGREYFKKHFNVRPTTAINFDPFGHTRGLVQILAGSGYDSYLFCRPVGYKFENPVFVWRGFDGSTVIGHKTIDWYNSSLGKAREKIEKSIDENAAVSPHLILWGVGNHGGGPSRGDLQQITDLVRERKDVNIRHATPEAFFKTVAAQKTNLPVHDKDINPTFPGCYTSQILVKQKHRQLENSLFSTEKMATAAWSAGLMDYPRDELYEAMRNLANCEFHDILPGSSVQPVEATSLRLMDHGLECLSRVRARAFFALASGQPKAKDGEIPILVYNPHPFEIEQTVVCEFGLHDFNWEGTFTNIQVYQNGRPLPTQVEEEISNLFMDWRKRVVFQAILAPSRMNRFDCRLEEVPEKPAVQLKTENGLIHFTSPKTDIVINAKTGLMDRYRVGGKDYLAKQAFRPVVIDHNEDPWGMGYRQFRDVAGYFELLSPEKSARVSGVRSQKLDPVRVIEDGPARSIVESIFGFNDSFLVLRYHLPKHGTEVEIEARVHWNEKDRMLKLSVPVHSDCTACYGQVAYGKQELARNGDENVSQKWTALVSEQNDGAVTIIDDGIYGSDFKDNECRLSLLRSPAYSAILGKDPTVMPQDRYSPRIDQGERLFHFWLNAGPKQERMRKIDREALAHNEKPMAVSFFPSGMGEKAAPFVTLGDDAIQVTAVKRAEDGNGIIVRLFEPTGQRRETTLRLPGLDMEKTVALDAFEIKSFRVLPEQKQWQACNLIEERI